MARQTYEIYRPQEDAALVIDRLNVVIREYQETRQPALTVRQLYYQCITRDLFPDTWLDPQAGTKNNVKNYKKLVNILGKARMGGLVDWSAIQDRGRNLEKVGTWDNPEEIMRAVANQFKLDLWEDQPYYVSCWIEKDALSGVMEYACNPLRVSWMACKGYMSLSEMRAQGLLLKALARKKDVCIIHLGDHDPSGIAMTQDIIDRLSIFAETPIEVVRIALNMDQVEQYNPPSNPGKESDPRFAAYEAEFGDESWELDALTPQILTDLITKSVLDHRDEAIWQASKQEEDYQKTLLRAASDNWASVKTHLEDYGLVEQEVKDDEDNDEED